MSSPTQSPLVTAAAEMIGAEPVWPATKKALDDEAASLLPRDRTLYWFRVIGRSFVEFFCAIPSMAGMMVPGLLFWPTWTMVVGLFATALPVFIAVRAWHIRTDERYACQVHELAARRRRDREAAEVLPAVVHRGGSVAVPGVVDKRVRDARS